MCDPACCGVAENDPIHRQPSQHDPVCSGNVHGDRACNESNDAGGIVDRQRLRNVRATVAAVVEDDDLSVDGAGVDGPLQTATRSGLD